MKIEMVKFPREDMQTCTVLFKDRTKVVLSLEQGMRIMAGHADAIEAAQAAYLQCQRCKAEEGDAKREEE